MKVKIKDTKLFKQVAKVLGGERAQHELMLVAHSCEVIFDKELVYAFFWNESPQGREFWNSIDEGFESE